MVSFIVFVFGLAVGSFLNAVIYRLEKGESALQGRSYCPHCKHMLSWQDLVPLVSFALLRGRCRYCKAPISWQYPFVELATATLFVGMLKIIFNSSVEDYLQHAILLVVASLLVVIFVYDLKHFLIPDKILYSAIVVSGIWYFVSGMNTRYEIQDTLYALAPTLFFLVLVLVSKETWMGFGDVKLALFMGLFLGWPNILVALFFAFLSGAAVGIALIFLKKKQLRSQVPFGPFLIGGTFLALFAGDFFVDWYVSLLVY